MNSYRMAADNQVNPTVTKFKNSLGEIFPAKDQIYFAEFNWFNFEAGDIIWLEDYTGNDASNKIAGVLQRFDYGNPIIRLLPAPATKRLARKSHIENVTQMADKAYWSIWMYY